jgi:hypothetical protein
MCTFVYLVSTIKGCSVQLPQLDIYQVSVGKILCKIVMGSCKANGDVRLCVCVCVCVCVCLCFVDRASRFISYE